MDHSILQKKPFRLDETERQWVSRTISGMSDREKCAQLFNVLGSFYPEDELDKLVADPGVGGVLFRPDRKEVVRRQFERVDHLAKIPLLKAANLEEGGAGILTDGTFFGNALQIAATSDLTCAESYAACCAKEGREVGVNWTFSPVVDIDFNYQNPITNVRTFGSDPARVSENGSAFVRTVQRYGMAASCKHFPGNGVDFRDQHNHPTWNTLSAEEWFATYGRVYQDMIKAGVLSIMVGHIVQSNVIRSIDPEAPLLPGSQSREMMTGVLREKFGFNGLIITDATLMGGYTMSMERRRAIPQSIMAGADMICFSTDIYEDIGFLLEALGDGRLTRERLDDAVARILALKAVLNRSYPEPQTDCPAEAARCADKAVTLVKNMDDVLPLTRERFSSVRLFLLGEDSCYDGSILRYTASELEKKGFGVEICDAMTESVHGVKELPQDRVTLIFCNVPTASFQTAARIFWSGGLSPELPRFVNEEPIVFVSLCNPYHLQDVPRVRTFINAYSASYTVIDAVLSKLLGESSFMGVSPVDAFCGLPDTRD